MARLLFVILSAWSVLLWSGTAAAAVKTQVSARKVGVGQPITVELSATQEEGEPAPSEPRLKVQGSAEVQGPSISTQSRVLMHNFNFRSEKSVVARYRVVPTKTGRLVVGPGSFSVGGQRVAGERIVVEVVDQPQRPAQRRRSPFDPFGNDPFGDDPLDDFFKRRQRAFRLPDAPPEFQLEHAADPIAFAHARLSDEEVVVGQPLRLTIVAYGARGDFREQSPTEPSFSEFLSYRALDDVQSEPTYQTEIDGRTYVVKKLREYILVPLESGQLSIGEMKTVIQSPRRTYPSHQSPLGFSIATLPLTVNVVAPPQAGRPPGYLVGDVGRYELSASVAPRSVTQGEYVEVIVTVEGRGQVPSQVQLPEGQGMVWEKPSISGEPEVQNGVLLGKRVLKYPLQLNQTGTLSLGELRLPYYDARAGRYRVARASLGEVEITPRRTGALDPDDASPGAAPSGADAGSSSSPVAALPMSPRTELGPGPELTGRRVPGLWWALVLVLPALAWSGTALRSLFRNVAERRAARPGSHVKVSLAEARKELGAGQDRAALRVAERALVEAIEVHTGLKARGVLRNEVAHELQDRGVGAVVAREVEQLLIALEAARYGGGEQSPAELVSATEGLCGRLAKPARKRGGRR